VSVKQILEKAWEDCKEYGVELSAVDFTLLRWPGGETLHYEVEYRGRAIERKPQNQPDE